MTPELPARDPTAHPWRILSGLAVSGFLLALPGGLLPLWDYHIEPRFGTAAYYFLAVGLGISSASLAGYRWRARVHPANLLAGGCLGAALSLLLLSLSLPPAAVWYRVLVLFVAGCAAGAINMAVLEPIAPAYDANPARVTLAAGLFFSAGSVLSAWLLSWCLDAGSPQRILALTAIMPGLAAPVFAYTVPSRGEFPEPDLPVAEALGDLRSVLAILFALLLFFQFASEWSLAGWLPIFLIDRLGMNPASAVMMLALYWLSLTLGKFGATRLLPVVPHSRLLGFSAFCAVFGCFTLLATQTTLGVVLAILLMGAGFSSIYPLAAEKISTRFTYYHPGYFNGIFTFAMLGGMLAPFLFGFMAAAWGLMMLPIATIAGSCAVFILVLLIWLGRKVSGT